MRSTTTRQLLVGMGMIFNQDLHTLLRVGGYGGIRFPTREQMQKAGDNLFDSSVKTVSVDVFISHSWSAGRWEKFLALCLYLNLQMAVACCMMTWISFVVLMISWHGVSGLGGSHLLLPCFVYLPMTTFFTVFFFGQQLLGRPLGYFIFSFIGLKRTLFTHSLSEALKGQPGFLADSGLHLFG